MLAIGGGQRDYGLRIPISRGGGSGTWKSRNAILHFLPWAVMSK